MRNRHKYGADGKKYQFKGGASSPLLKHHDRLTAEHSQRKRCAQELAVSTGASCAVLPSLALPSMFAR